MAERVVPVLKAGEVEATLAFWQALGFDVLHDQRRPYVYLSVRRGAFQFDFSSGVQPALVLVEADDVDDLHQDFRAGLKAAMGRVPRTGLPRLGSVSQQKQDRRFNMADPAGNHLIVITPGVRSDDAPRSKLGQALKAARLSAYGQEDLGWAAEHLDKALTAATDEEPRTLLSAWVLRADIAALQDDRAALVRAINAGKALDVVPASDDHLRLAELASDAGIE